MPRRNHLQRLARRIDRRAALVLITKDPHLLRAGRLLGGRLFGPANGVADLGRLSGRLKRRERRRHRQTLASRRPVVSPRALFDRTDAIRRLARMADHAARLAYLTAQAG